MSKETANVRAVIGDKIKEHRQVIDGLNRTIKSAQDQITAHQATLDELIKMDQTVMNYHDVMVRLGMNEQ